MLIDRGPAVSGTYSPPAGGGANPPGAPSAEGYSPRDHRYSLASLAGPIPGQSPNAGELTPKLADQGGRPTQHTNPYPYRFRVASPLRHPRLARTRRVRPGPFGNLTH